MTKKPLNKKFDNNETSDLDYPGCNIRLDSDEENEVTLCDAIW